MKTVSIAVLALIGEISAEQIQRRHHNFVQKKLNRNMYPETAAGRQWFELDDHTERIHGTEEMDDVSPHDPEVVDAPEDMKRVGNDHETLHNAKLSPDGYYNGFHHKDYQGNYVQKAQRHHKRHHHHKHGNDYVQMSYDHENDTEDIPEGLDPIHAQRGSAQQRIDDANAWQRYFNNAAVQVQAQQNEDEWDKMYAQEEDEQSYEFVQTARESYWAEDQQDQPNGFDPVWLAQKKAKRESYWAEDQQDQPHGFDPVWLHQKRSRAKYEHENDTEDIPDGLDPILVQRKRKWTHVNDHYDSPKEKKAAPKKEEKKPEPKKEAAKAASFVQKRSYYEHENDTEDIPDGLDPIFVQHKRRGKWTHVNDHYDSPKEQKAAPEKAEKPKAKKEAKKPASFIQKRSYYEHENDTEDIPDGLDPILAQRRRKGKWTPVNDHYDQHNQNNFVSKKFRTNGFAQQKMRYEHENDTEDIPDGLDPINFSQHKHHHGKHKHHKNHLLQLKSRYDHENDTEDIPDGLDPINLQEDDDVLVDYDQEPSGFHVRGQFKKSKNQLLQEKEDMRLQEQSNEIQQIMDEQAKDDVSHLQLTSWNIPHEDDTDDIALEENPVFYDQHHSKQWNAEVNKRADELEKEMQIQENLKIAESKAKEEAQRKANEQKARAEAERRRQAEAAKQPSANWGSNKKTIDLSELYAELPAESNLMIGDAREYRHHSAFWESKVDNAADALEQQMQDVEEDHPELDGEEAPNHKTVDLADVYDGMVIQTNYENHSKFFKQRVEEEASKTEKEYMFADDEDEEPATKKPALASAIKSQGMTPAQFSQKNPSVDFGDMYKDLVQLGDHYNDSDDVVPELNMDEKPEPKKTEKKPKNIDFNGQEYEEFYDE